jgi:hypothetical protein
MRRGDLPEVGVTFSRNAFGVRGRNRAGHLGQLRKNPMDALTETTIVHQAAAEDIRRLLDEGFERLRLQRNYGDWLEVQRTAAGDFRAAYYDAVANQRLDAAASWTPETVKEAVLDYLEGHWNWHGLTEWKPAERRA